MHINKRRKSASVITDIWCLRRMPDKNFPVSVRTVRRASDLLQQCQGSPQKYKHQSIVHHTHHPDLRARIFFLRLSNLSGHWTSSQLAWNATYNKYHIYTYIELQLTELTFCMEFHCPALLSALAPARRYSINKYSELCLTCSRISAGLPGGLNKLARAIKTPAIAQCQPGSGLLWAGVIMISPLIITFLMTDKPLLWGDKTHPVLPGPTRWLERCDCSLYTGLPHCTLPPCTAVSQSPSAGRGEKSCLLLSLQSVSPMNDKQLPVSTLAPWCNQLVSRKL